MIDIEYSGHISKGGKSSVLFVFTTISKIFILFLGLNQESMEYVYLKNVIGEANFNKMIELAKAGKGLNSFIIRNKIPGGLA